MLSTTSLQFLSDFLSIGDQASASLAQASVGRASLLVSDTDSKGHPDTAFVFGKYTDLLDEGYEEIGLWVGLFLYVMKCSQI